MYNVTNAVVYFLIRVVLFVVLLIFGGRILADKKRGHQVAKGRVIFTVATLILFLCANIFMYTHKINYKYCDNWIIGKNIEQVKERYGEFDYKKEYIDSEGGRVAYFLYHDEGFLPDYQDHYFVMKYDKDGVVIEVGDQTL